MYKIGRAIFDRYAREERDVCSAKEKLHFDRGVEPGSPRYLNRQGNNTVRFIRVGDMEESYGNTFVQSDLCKIFAEERDILMSFDGSVGRVTYGVNGAFSTGIRRVYSDDNAISNAFIYYYLTSDYVRNVLDENAIGTTIKHASKAIDVFSMPYSDRITKIAPSLQSIFNKQLAIKAENSRLAALRDTLLPELMNGKIDLSKVEI